MSFLSTGYSATVAARLTQKGRNSISNGNFNVKYFTIGDSEFNYNGPNPQNVLTPFDRDVDVKYPLWYTSGTTIYGVPVSSAMTSTCSDIMTSDATGWTSTVIWETNPIGYTGTTAYTGFTNSPYLGTKSYFGYSSTSGQTYYSSTGVTTGTTTGTTITDTIGNKIVVVPEEQKTIAVLHYTQNGGSVDSYFKYDDYISTSTGITYNNSLTDQQYFKVTIPSLMYHRSSGTTAGESFYMSKSGTKMIGSNRNSNYIIDYVDLVDYTGNTVGKIFFNQQTIIFDDEEIAAALDTTTSRNYTLPAPHVNVLVTNNDPITALTTGHTLWITYNISGGTTNNDLPCNYFMKVTGSSNNEVVTVQFSGNSFNFLNNGYTGTSIQLLYQLTTGNTPSATQWKYIDVTSDLNNDITNLKTGHTFTITQTKYTSATSYNSTLQFTGQTGNATTVQLVRSSDIEEMCFNLSLPINTFSYSQNPTLIGTTPSITEVSLLDGNKNTLVMGKLAAPIQRIGAQVIQVKLDF